MTWLRAEAVRSPHWSTGLTPLPGSEPSPSLTAPRPPTVPAPGSKQVAEQKCRDASTAQPFAAGPLPQVPEDSWCVGAQSSAHAHANPTSQSSSCVPSFMATLRHCGGGRWGVPLTCTSLVPSWAHSGVRLLCKAETWWLRRQGWAGPTAGVLAP